MKKKWKNYLDDWTRAGLLTTEQSDKIFQFESARPQAPSYAALVMTWLGVAVIGMGVISIVAANWSQIPDMVKLAASFGVTGAVGYQWTRTNPEERPLVFEALIFLFMLLVLATIGLISQIFHTGGKLQHALLFWLAITSFAAAQTRSRWTAHLWVGALLGSLVFTGIEMEIFGIDFRKESNFLGVIFAMPFLTGLLALAVGKLAGEIPLVSAFRYWLVYSGILALGTQDLWRVFDSRNSVHGATNTFQIGFALALAALAALWFHPAFTSKRKLLLGLVIFLYVVYFQFPAIGVTWRPAYGGMNIVILLLMAAHVVTLGENKLFDALIGLVALRFLGLYFQALGGLAATGFGLILSGLLILGTVSLWHKRRRQIHRWAEEFLK